MNALRLETGFFFFPGRIFEGLNHCFRECVRAKGLLEMSDHAHKALLSPRLLGITCHDFKCVL